NSFWKLRNVDPGFRADHVLAANVAVPVGPGQVDRLVPAYTDLLSQLRSIPAVESAGFAKDLPLNAIRRSRVVQVENRADVPATAEAIYQIASPGYLQTLRIPILSGRDFSDADTRESTPVAVINTAMARAYWAQRNPIGERIRFEGFAPKPQWLTIVGVA